jgi:hypothetical protein
MSSCWVYRQLHLFKHYEASWSLTHTILFCRQFEVLCMGIASLHAFIQNNWTGPPLDSDSTSNSSLILWLQSWYEGSILNKKQLKDEVTACLVLDGESCSSVMSHPELLLLSRVCLQVCCDRPQPLPVSIIFVCLVLFKLRQCLTIYDSARFLKYNIKFSVFQKWMHFTQHSARNYL